MSRTATPAPRRLSTWTTASYGFGSVAYGVKDAGFGTFLLIFYNQVIGLDASTVGLIIFVALVCDAFVDPMIGVLSDRTRGRWGRRPWARPGPSHHVPEVAARRLVRFTAGIDDRRSSSCSRFVD